MSYVKKAPNWNASGINEPSSRTHTHTRTLTGHRGSSHSPPPPHLPSVCFSGNLEGINFSTIGLNPPTQSYLSPLPPNHFSIGWGRLSLDLCDRPQCPYNLLQRESERERKKETTSQILILDKIQRNKKGERGGKLIWFDSFSWNWNISNKANMSVSSKALS